MPSVTGPIAEPDWMRGLRLAIHDACEAFLKKQDLKMNEQLGYLMICHTQMIATIIALCVQHGSDAPKVVQAAIENLTTALNQMGITSGFMSPEEYEALINRPTHETVQ